MIAGLVEGLRGGLDQVSLPALQARAAAIRAATELDLGELDLYQPTSIPPPASTWDARDWGTYSAD